MLHFLNTLEPFILVLHFVICIFLIVAILLQAGKGADMGAAFGAGSSQTLFGARGAATFLQKVTAIAAMLFLVTSISLAAVHKSRSIAGGGKSVVDEGTTPATEKPKAPATEAPVPSTSPAPPAQ